MDGDPSHEATWRGFSLEGLYISDASSYNCRYDDYGIHLHLMNRQNFFLVFGARTGSTFVSMKSKHYSQGGRGYLFSPSTVYLFKNHKERRLFNASWELPCRKQNPHVKEMKSSQNLLFKLRPMRLDLTWIWILEFDQDLCKNLLYKPNPRVR